MATAAELLGFRDPQTVTKLIRQGKLKGHRMGTGDVRPRYRVSRQAIQEYLNQTEAKPQ